MKKRSPPRLTGTQRELLAKLHAAGEHGVYCYRGRRRTAESLVDRGLAVRRYEGHSSCYLAVFEDAQ